MKQFTFDVIRTESYKATIDIEAGSEKAARVLLEKELESDPIDYRKNTYTGSHEIIHLVQVLEHVKTY